MLRGPKTVVVASGLVLAAAACTAKEATKQPPAAAAAKGTPSGGTAAPPSAVKTSGQAQAFTPSAVRPEIAPFALAQFPALGTVDFHAAAVLNADGQARKDKYANGGADGGEDFDAQAFAKQMDDEAATTDKIIADAANGQVDDADGNPVDPSFHPRPELDLSGYDSAVKDQGNDGQCTAYAVVAALENIVGGGLQPSPIDLSEAQQWVLQGKKPDPTKALSASIDGPGLADDLDYADGKTKGAGRVTAWKLLTQSRLDAKTKKRLPANPATIVDYLVREHKPLIGVFRINDSWYSKEGFVLSGGPLIEVAHAVTIVGYSAEMGSPNKTVLLFKNSWGMDWGASGYGMVPLSYCNLDYANDPKMFCAFYTIDGEALK